MVRTLRTTLWRTTWPIWNRLEEAGRRVSIAFGRHVRNAAWCHRLHERQQWSASEADTGVAGDSSGPAGANSGRRDTGAGCPVEFPVKVTAERLAYPVDHPGYAAAMPTICYVSMDAAAAAQYAAAAIATATPAAAQSAPAPVATAAPAPAAAAASGLGPVQTVQAYYQALEHRSSSLILQALTSASSRSSRLCCQFKSRREATGSTT
jgi:hypothetical protein